MDIKFNESITEIINKRHSVRNYDNRELSEDVKKQLMDFIEKINNTKGPFGNSIRVNLVESKKNSEELKLGTYGVIRGARYYLTAVCKDAEKSYEDLGFLFEKVILYCTSLGLGTVWMAGTFSKNDFAKAVNLMEDEKLLIVAPLGYEGGKKTLLGKIFGDNSKKRKEFESICFDGSFNTPLDKENAGKYSLPLEMVRVAPSAVNKQPWKILKSGDKLHFFNEGKGEHSRIDMGIAMCHFELTAKENGLSGEFKAINGMDVNKYRYVATWIEE